MSNSQNTIAIEQFAKVEHEITLDLKSKNLSLVDIYVYAVMKLNSDYKKNNLKCSLEYLKKVTKLSMGGLRESLKTLKEAGYIDYSAVANVCTTYKFTCTDVKFEKLPAVFVLDPTLEPREKGYMICVYQFSIKDQVTKEEYTTYAPSTLAKYINITKSVALDYTKKLVEKGYIEEIKAAYKGIDTKIWKFSYKKMALMAEERIHVLQQRVLFLEQELENQKLHGRTQEAVFTEKDLITSLANQLSTLLNTTVADNFSTIKEVLSLTVPGFKEKLNLLEERNNTLDKFLESHIERIK